MKERRCPRCGSPLYEGRRLFLRRVYRWLECSEASDHFKFPRRGDEDGYCGFMTDEEMDKHWNDFMEILESRVKKFRACAKSARRLSRTVGTEREETLKKAKVNLEKAEAMWSRLGGEPEKKWWEW